MRCEKTRRDGIVINPNHIYVDRGISGASVVDMQMRIDGNPWRCRLMMPKRSSRNGDCGSVLPWESEVECKKGIDKGGRIV